MPPTLGYWNYRGLGEPIRYLLNYLGVEFEDKRYKFGPAPNYFDCPWLNTEKKSIGLDFPNLPYFIDGDLKITQSNVIMRYLARKHGGLYLPEGTGNDVLKFNMTDGHMTDLLMDFHIQAYSPLFEQNRAVTAARSEGQLRAASKFLADKKWIMGDQISHIDFTLFEALDILQYAFPNCLEQFENLVKHHERFASLPAIQKFRKNSPKWPILSPKASFGGRGDPPK